MTGAVRGNPALNGFPQEDSYMTAVETYDDGVPPRRGVSLAKGPVALIGVASLALGVLGFIFASQSFTMHPPSGTVNGGTFIGIEGNGWTWLLFAAGGLLLLLGAPIHWGAKSMAFIVGVAYGVGALIALSDGSDILGIFATNNLTKLVLGAAAVALVLLSMAPRLGRRRGTAPARREPAERGRFGRRSARAEREPVTDRADREPVANGRAAREPVTADGGAPDDRRRRA
jgi:fumarate reductase subunit D